MCQLDTDASLEEMQAKLTAVSDAVMAEGFVPISRSGSEASLDMTSSSEVMNEKPWSREGRFADLLDKLADLRLSLRRARDYGSSCHHTSSFKIVVSFSMPDN